MQLLGHGSETAKHHLNPSSGTANRAQATAKHYLNPSSGTARTVWFALPLRLPLRQGRGVGIKKKELKQKSFTKRGRVRPICDESSRKPKNQKTKTLWRSFGFRSKDVFFLVFLEFFFFKDITRGEQFLSPRTPQVFPVF